MKSENIASGQGRLFPEGRAAGPMPWVIAIMMFLTVLAAAAGLALSTGASSIEGQVGNRLTVQVVEPNPELRADQANRLTAALQRTNGVTAVRRVPEEEVSRLLEPWLGANAAEADVPVPAMIDLDLAEGSRGELPRLRSLVQSIAPSAIVSDVADWLAPLASLLDSLQWLALGLVALMIGATAATVVLAARGSLNTHRQTIEILHLMGATEHQIARMFQRRIALDVLFGGMLGFALAILVLLLIGARVAAVESDLLAAAELPSSGWFLLAGLPLAGALLALLVARVTILRALARLL